MDETSQVVDVLDTLVASVTNPVSVSISDTARNGLDKLRGALEVKDIDTLVGPDRPDVLSKPPPGMTDPEDLKYFDLYRQSFTKEHIQMPGSQRMQNASKAHGTCVLCPALLLTYGCTAFQHMTVAPANFEFLQSSTRSRTTRTLSGSVGFGPYQK
jgi:hypothetical protein